MRAPASCPAFCYSGHTLGSGGGVPEAAEVRVRSAWAKFKELSAVLTVRGASYRQLTIQHLHVIVTRVS